MNQHGLEPNIFHCVPTFRVEHLSCWCVMFWNGLLFTNIELFSFNYMYNKKKKKKSKTPKQKWILLPTTDVAILFELKNE